MSRNDRTGPLATTPAGIAGTLVLFAIVALCVRLGFWQLARLDQRRELNAGIAARLELSPIGDITQLGDTAGAAYRTASVRGVYDNDRYIVFPGRSRQGVPGVHLIVPLRIEDRAAALLVNRGWVPAADAVTIDTTALFVHGVTDVAGLVLSFPGAAQSLARRADVSHDTAFRRVWFAFNERALRTQFPYPLMDVMLQELRVAHVDRSGYPIQLDPPALDEGPHLGYAIQWFSFAIIGIAGWFALVLRNRPRSGPRTYLTTALLFLAVPTYAAAQLRPIDPLEWRVFDARSRLVLGLGAGALWDHPATTAGTRGTLLEIGRYGIAFRSGRIAIEIDGTAFWRLTEKDTLAAPLPEVGPSNGVRQDAGVAMASTLVRVSPDDWPVDLVLRFGATIPTTSDESGLDRDRTDFLALLAARYRRGPLTLTAENGVGINGTLREDLPQADVWTFAFGAAWSLEHARLVTELVGRDDAHTFLARGNEDQRELRAGVDIGNGRWLSIRYVRGLEGTASPGHGLRIGVGVSLWP